MAVNLAEVMTRQQYLAASHIASKPPYHRRVGDSRLPALAGGIDIVVVRSVDVEEELIQVQQVRPIDDDPANGFEGTGELIEAQPWPQVLIDYYVAFATEGAINAATNVLPLLTTAAGTYLMQHLKWALMGTPLNYQIYDGMP